MSQRQLQPRIQLETLRACPLCTSPDSELLLEERNEFAHAHAAWSYLNEEPVRIRRCRDCGFGYTGALPPREFFEKILYAPAPGAPVVGGPDVPAGKEYIFRHVLRLLARHGAHGRLLDLGACSGRFLWHARDFFAQVSGIENDAAAATQAARHGIEIRVGSILGELPAFQGKVDVITLIDVLEHLLDPLAQLRAIHETLPAGGLLYVKVPHQWGQLWKERLIAALGVRPSKMAVNFVHINHFSEGSLRRALTSLGFELVHAEVAPPELYQWRGTRTRERLSNILRLAQYFFARLIRRLSGKNFGLNVEVLARKRGAGTKP